MQFHRDTIYAENLMRLGEQFLHGLEGVFTMWRTEVCTKQANGEWHKARERHSLRDCTGDAHTYSGLDRQDVANGRPFNASDVTPLLRHRNQGMHPRFYRSQSLRQGRGFSVGRDHEKRTQSL